MNKALPRSLQNRLQDILRRRHLSVTDSRKKILSLFLSSHEALTHGDIESNAGEKFDRVTVYRTLQSFEEKGIIHAIPTPDNSVRYALCKDCEEGHHHDDHVHFICEDCHRTICLDRVVFPKIDLPTGYETKHMQVVINGRCALCTPT